MTPATGKCLTAAVLAAALGTIIVTQDDGVSAAGPLAPVAITEVHPSGSGNGTYAADWFEVTNTGHDRDGHHRLEEWTTARTRSRPPCRSAV